MIVAILFMGLWVGVTVPIALTAIFAILHPLTIKDTSGISMLIIGLIVALLDGFIGIKLFEKIIQPIVEKRRKKRKFP